MGLYVKDLLIRGSVAVLHKAMLDEYPARLLAEPRMAAIRPPDVHNLMVDRRRHDLQVLGALVGGAIQSEGTESYTAWCRRAGVPNNHSLL